MPVATASSEGQRKDLTSLDGAFVVLRKLTYGEILERRQMAASLRGKLGGKNANKDGTEITVDMYYLAVQHFDFQRCIVEHNLTDASDNPLDFRVMSNVKALDPVVAQEVEDFIDELNEPKSDREGLSSKQSPFQPKDS